MLKKSIEKAFNEQINKEFFSAYLYLSMSNYFQSINLKGFAHWMYIQFQEEQQHAMKFFDYVNERGSQALLTTIKAPKTSWKSPIEVFEESYKHECFITKSINSLVLLSQKEQDFASINFLNWFVQEQVEEEANASDIFHKLKLIKNESTALYLLDKELQSRILPSSK